MKTRIILTFFALISFHNLMLAGDSIYYSGESEYKTEASSAKKSDLAQNTINVFIDSNYAIHISVGGSYKKATAILYDLLGKETNKVILTNSPDYIWTISKGIKGIFLLKVQTEKTTYVKKVVIQ